MTEASQLITAITALVAVFFSPLVALYIARRQIRSSVVSTNRHTWINTLRDTLAEYLSKQAMARNLNRQKYADECSIKRIEEIIRLHQKIELMINPNEKDHAELVELISAMTNTMNRTNGTNEDLDIDSYNDQIVALSQKIFKREWDRVKRGE